MATYIKKRKQNLVQQNDQREIEDKEQVRNQMTAKLMYANKMSMVEE